MRRARWWNCGFALSKAWGGLEVSTTDQEASRDSDDSVGDPVRNDSYRARDLASTAWVIGILAVALVFAGCQTQDDALSESTAARQSELHRGVNAGVADLQGVVNFMHQGNSGCSGVLISPNMVLGSAHCLRGAFGTGCDPWWGQDSDIIVRIPKPEGNPADSGYAQHIRVDGIAVHPLWRGGPSRVCKGTPDHQDCSPEVLDTLGPYCNVIRDCFDHGAAGFGVHQEHDLAMFHLASPVVGVKPIPVIVSTDDFTPPSGKLRVPLPETSELVTYPWAEFEQFMTGRPRVTIVGYGVGSRVWSTDPLVRNRDMGTATLESLFWGEGLRDDCNGAVENVTIPALRIQGPRDMNVLSDVCDSGGAMLIGFGDGVPGFPVQPTALPEADADAFRLGSNRYLVGITSRGSKNPVGGGSCVMGCKFDHAPCASSADCRGGQECIPQEPCADGFVCVEVNKWNSGKGVCGRPCNVDADCVDLDADSACYAGTDIDPPVCRVALTLYAATYTPENGQWIKDALRDLDGDGIRNSKDNCVGVPDYAGVPQVNCNDIAEQEKDAYVLGNICDPVPCPLTEAEVNYTVPVFQVPFKGDGLKGENRVVRNSIVHGFIGSHNMFNGFEMKQEDVLTEYRFCQPDLNFERHCTVKQIQTNDVDFEGDDKFEPSAEYAIRWRKVTMSKDGVSWEKGLTGYFSYPSSEFTGTWDYWRDRYDWINDGYFNGVHLPPTSKPDTERKDVSGLSGWFGVRAGGKNSASLLGAWGNDDNGIHYYRNEPSGTDMHGYDMGRSYWELTPDAIESYSYFSILCPGTCRFEHLDLREYVKRVKEKITDPKPWLAAVPGKIVVVSDGTDFGFLRDSGFVVPTSGLYSWRLDRAMGDDRLMFVAAVEPYIGQGIVYDDVQGIVMSKDGTAIMGSVVATADGLDLLGSNAPALPQSDIVNLQRTNSQQFGMDSINRIEDAEVRADALSYQASSLLDSMRQSGPIQLPSACESNDANAVPREIDGDSQRIMSDPTQKKSDDAVGLEASNRMDAANSRVSQELRDQATDWVGQNEQGLCIPPRRDFVPVLSRILGTLFIVGGHAENGANTGEIWMVTNNASPVLLDVPGYAPRRVMAATLGLRDHMLWVLDEG